MSLFPIIYEDAEVLVLHKPAGLVCHPTKGDEYSSLVSRVRLHLGTRSEPQMVHRLDRETSGVMVFGKTAASALELRRLWEQGLVAKEYSALVHGAAEPGSGTIDLPLGADDRSEIAIKDCVRPDGTPARTRWWRERVFERAEGVFSQLRIRLDTGRKHQIRIHLAAVGHPLVGDKLYGPSEALYLDFVHRRLTDHQRAQLLLPHQALHAGRLWFPWQGCEAEFASPPESWFSEFAAGLPVVWGPDAFDPARPGP
ncbi:MAG TPA: RluA family pseudouridine synthase [Verrucomicrobiota bacterium]|nr:RluA family pseudouridine synthase [Verrucomicrobiota bacterium]